MYKIRQIKYTANSVSIQVYKIENRKRVIVCHLGTARTDQEKLDLLTKAKQFIEKATKQIELFEQDAPKQVLILDQTEFIGVRYMFLYELLFRIIAEVGFDKIADQLLLDLIVIRMVEPSSKHRSIELLEEYFGKTHRRQQYYDLAPEWLKLKLQAETTTIEYAKKSYSFNFDLLFYDVTTLYFETFEEDELRKNGFSKDNKSQQPQILIALMVTKEGFPIAYEVYPGNTFEGHTIVPLIKKFIAQNGVKNFTVIADAAMISNENVLNLKQNNIDYIVGARLGNLNDKLITQISTALSGTDKKIIRIKTDKGYLICNFSSLRYRKDKHEMNKQVERAKKVINNPSKNKKLKFTKSNGEVLELNQQLIEKANRLLGIKGYYTSHEENTLDNQTIIDRYHELYKIEKAFRMSKSDLKTRPIFHYKEDPIKLHLLICFMALVVSKQIELKTEISIKNFIHECKKVTDARLINKITRQEVTIRANYTAKLEAIKAKFAC